MGLICRVAINQFSASTLDVSIMWRQESLEKPFEREVLILTKKSGVDIMKAFKKDGKMVKVTGLKFRRAKR